MNPEQNQQSNIPSIKQPGNWSPLDNYTNDMPPPKQSFVARYKKLIIVSAVAVLLLVGLAVLTALTSPKKASDQNLEGAKTYLETVSYSDSSLSLNYLKGLNILENKDLSSGEYQLVLAENTDNSPYNISINISEQDPLYPTSADGLNSNIPGDVQLTNVLTTDVVMAGKQTQKSYGELVGEDGKSYYEVYTGVNINSKFVTVNAEYPKDDKNINDSFDAMLGSIKLK